VYYLNHDEERIAKVFRQNIRRVLPLTGFLLTTTGLPMVYQGQEVGFGATIEGDARREPVTWQTPVNWEFAQYYQQVAQARIQFPAFWTQELRTLNTQGSVYSAYARKIPRNGQAKHD